VGALLRLEEIREDLLAIDIDDPFHASNLLAVFSRRGSQSLTCSLEGLTGTPRYFCGSIN